MLLRYVTTPIASRLTGLSTQKLREWTSRRALIPADVRPKQKGSPAKFSWQTILMLRIAALLRECFNLELQAHKASFASLRQDLRKRSFITLWGHRLVLSPEGWSLIQEGAPLPHSDLLLIQLDPHLHALRDGFALPDAAAERGQLDLFCLPNLRHAHRVPSVAEAFETGRRRSA
jgi:hypothetical protein